MKPSHKVEVINANLPSGTGFCSRDNHPSRFPHPTASNNERRPALGVIWNFPHPPAHSILVRVRFNFMSSFSASLSLLQSLCAQKYQSPGTDALAAGRLGLPLLVPTRRHRAQESRHVFRGKLDAQGGTKLVNAKAAQVFVEIAQDRRQCERLDPD